MVDGDQSDEEVVQEPRRPAGSERAYLEAQSPAGPREERHPANSSYLGQLTVRDTTRELVDVGSGGSYQIPGETATGEHAVEELAIVEVQLDDAVAGPDDVTALQGNRAAPVGHDAIAEHAARTDDLRLPPPARQPLPAEPDAEDSDGASATGAAESQQRPWDLCQYGQDRPIPTCARSQRTNVVTIARRNGSRRSRRGDVMIQLALT